MKKTILCALVLGSILGSTQAFAQYPAPPVTPAPTPVVELTTVVVNDENERLLADSRGNTLYVFDVDQAGKSACNATCAEIWPPYLITDEEAKSLKAPYGTVLRDNKKVQLTRDGRPLYTYALDRGYADDSGDGIGEVWHYIELEEVK